MRHVTGSVSFFDDGVKKLETALPEDSVSQNMIDGIKRYKAVLVVVDSIFRFVGGGDSEAPSAFLFNPAMAVVFKNSLAKRRKEIG